MTETGATIKSGKIRKPSAESEIITPDVPTVEEPMVEVAEIAFDGLSMHTEKQEDEVKGAMLSSDNETHCRDIDGNLKIVKDSFISKIEMSN